MMIRLALGVLLTASIVGCTKEPEPDIVVEYVHVDVANKLPGVESLPLNKTLPDKNHCSKKPQLGNIAVASNGTKYVCMGSGWRIIEIGTPSKRSQA